MVLAGKQLVATFCADRRMRTPRQEGRSAFDRAFTFKQLVQCGMQAIFIHKGAEMLSNDACLRCATMRGDRSKTTPCFGPKFAANLTFSTPRRCAPAS
jgi:hypothetical protein